MATAPKTVLLNAKTIVDHGGKRLGKDMQFHANADEAKRLIESGEAEEVKAEHAAEPAKK